MCGLYTEHITMCIQSFMNIIKIGAKCLDVRSKLSQIGQSVSMPGPSCLRLGRVSRCWGQVVSDWAECLDAGSKLSQIGLSVSMSGPSCLRLG